MTHKIECQKMLHCNLRIPCSVNCDDYVPCLNVVEEIEGLTKEYKESKEVPGGSTPSQYQLPNNATDLQDLIEHRGMNFAQGNIFKAQYRRGLCSHSDELRDAIKTLWFAQREVDRLSNNKT